MNNLMALYDFVWIWCGMFLVFFCPPHAQNAYAATAINSTSFCTSARDAFVILVENALRVATINTVGDFVLFLGKVKATGIFKVLTLKFT